MTNTAIGEYFQFEIPYTNYRNLEAVVIYDSSNGELNNRKLTLLNNTVAIQEISFDNSTNSQNTFTKVTKIKGGSYNPKVKKLKKIRFETTKNYNLALSELQIWSNNNNVTQNNSTITTSELVTANSIIDQSLNTIYRTNTGTGKYIDLTLTNQVDVSDIQGIVAYTEIDSSRNPIINKIKYETTSDVKLELNEIQLWTDNSNILNNASKLTSSSGSDVSNIIDNNFSTYYTSNQGTSEYIEYDLSNLNIRLNDIQSIVVYPSEHDSNTDLSNQRFTKLTLFDNSNGKVIERINNNESISSSVYKFNGTSYYDYSPKIKSLKLETLNNMELKMNEIQVWINNKNILKNNINITTPSLYFDFRDNSEGSIFIDNSQNLNIFDEITNKQIDFSNNY